MPTISGTAIIAAAGLINTLLELASARIKTPGWRCNGRAASVRAWSFAPSAFAGETSLYDFKGVIYMGAARGMWLMKSSFAVKADKRTLAEARPVPMCSSAFRSRAVRTW